MPRKDTDGYIGISSGTFGRHFYNIVKPGAAVVLKNPLDPGFRDGELK